MTNMETRLREENAALKRRLLELEKEVPAFVGLRDMSEEMKLFATGPVVLFRWRNETGWPVEFVSANVKAVLGYDADEFLKGQVPYSSILFPDDVERVNEEVRAHSDSGDKHFMHEPYRIVRKDGRVIWLLDNTVILRDAEDLITHYLGYVLDITERVKAEERWRFAIEGAGDGLWDWDATTNTVFFSDRWKSMLGHGPDDVGDTLSEWERRVHPDDMEQVMTDLTAHMEGKSDQYENVHRVRCKDGSCKWILDRGRVIERDAAGNPLRVIGTHSDFTERKRAEEALRQAEERYRTLLEFLPDGVMLFDPETFSLIEFNEAAHQQLGYSREEFWGIRIPDFEVLETPEQTAARVRKILETGRDDFETVHRRKDSSIMNVSVTVNMIEVAGSPALLTVSRDITDRKRAEEALTISETRLRTIFERANLSIAFSDAQGKVLLFNNRFAKLVCYSPEELTGMDFGVFTHPDDLPEESKFFLEIQRAEIDEYRMEKRYMTKWGETLWVDLAVAAIRDDAGQAVNFVGMVVDITERKRAEEALRQAHDQMEARVLERTTDLQRALEELRLAKDQAESASRMKSNFLASVSHELRTPLNGIQGMLQLLEGSELNEEQQDFVTEAGNASAHLLRMIEDILVVTSLEKYSLHVVPASLITICESVEHQLGPRAREKGLCFSCARSNDCPEIIMVDMKLIMLALSTLIMNAIKFTEFGEIRVAIAAENKDAEQVDLLFTVTDTGVGIPPEKLKAVTSGLAQGDSSYARHYGGMGLGIETVRKALDLHGGKLKVESELGRGSVFTFRLIITYCEGDALDTCLPSD